MYIQEREKSCARRADAVATPGSVCKVRGSSRFGPFQLFGLVPRTVPSALIDGLPPSLLPLSIGGQNDQLGSLFACLLSHPWDRTSGGHWADRSTPWHPTAYDRRLVMSWGKSIDNSWVSSGICAGYDFHRMGLGRDYVPRSPPPCRFDRTTRQNGSCFDLGHGSSASGSTNPVLLWHLNVRSDGRSDLGYLSSLINLLAPVTLPPPAH